MGSSKGSHSFQCRRPRKLSVWLKIFESSQGIAKLVGSIGNSSGEPPNGTGSLQRSITKIVETQGRTLPHNTNYLTTATENTGTMLHVNVRSPSFNMDSHIEHFTLQRTSSEKYPREGY